jgi:hypothetical protein
VAFDCGAGEPGQVQCDPVGARMLLVEAETFPQLRGGAPGLPLV